MIFSKNTFDKRLFLYAFVVAMVPILEETIYSVYIFPHLQH